MKKNIPFQSSASLSVGILVYAFFMLFSIPLSSGGPAYAAAITLPQTGQTACYDTTGAVAACSGTSGQDGNLLTGTAWPNPRFEANASAPDSGNTVTDNLTGLVWTKDDASRINVQCSGGTGCQAGLCTVGGTSWQEALDFMACLNNASAFGHNDWRLPNINELRSLVHSGVPDIGLWLNTQGFPNITSGYYWSSTTFEGTRNNAWLLSLWDGSLSYSFDKANGYYIWPVRGEPGGKFKSLVVWQTDQTACYSQAGVALPSCLGTGQDGEFQKGIAWPNPRFSITYCNSSGPCANNVPCAADTYNDIVTDNLTGLIWPRNGFQGSYNWPGAFTTYSICGYTDWRIPNRNELSSLINYGQYPIVTTTTTWLQDQGFANIQSGAYWSSTTYDEVDAPPPAPPTYSSVWVTYLFNGYEDFIVKAAASYVFPVRVGSGLYGSPAVSGLPASYTYTASVPSRTESSPNSFTITNTGTNNLYINALSFTGVNPDQFAIVPGTDLCSNMILAPSASCTVAVVFAPTTSGAKTANLTVTSNSPASPLSVALSGTALDPGCVGNPVWLVGSAYYTDIPTAYSFVSGTTTMRLYSASFTGPLYFMDASKNFQITLQGGYDCLSGIRTGYTTITEPALPPPLPPMMTIGSGTVVMDNIIIQ